MRLDQINSNFNSKSILNQKGPDLGIRLDIGKIKTFLALIGNPQDTIPFTVHIAGTNGKGSTLAFLEALLSQFPLKTGKYTSPHLISITERFSINGQNIAEQRLDHLIQEFSEIDLFHELTFFEKLTACAFKYFAEEKVDILLLETGLGGRLDATNVIAKPSICLISSIDIDHTEFLGNSIEEIAREKAGILKTHIPFATTAHEPALSVIRFRAKEISSPEIHLNADIKNLITNNDSGDSPPKSLGLKGIHQVDNAMLAVTAFDYLLDSFVSNICPEQLIKDIQTKEKQDLYKPIFSPISWLGRFQEIEYKSKKIILDGAHNQEGAQSLRDNLDIYFPIEKRMWLFGSLKTKNWQSFLKTLIRTNDQVFPIYASQQNLSVSPSEINAFLSNDLGILKTFNVDYQRVEKEEFIDFLAEQESGQKDIDQEFDNKFEEFINSIPENSIGIITGSLYLIGRVLERNQRRGD